MSEQQDYASQFKGKSGFGRIIKAMKYSKDGLKAAFKNEAAFRSLCFLHTGLLLTLCFLPLSLTVKILLVMVSFLSMVVELINTGIEAIVDRVSTEYHPLSKIAKDVGSAAQLMMLVLTLIVWAMAISSLF